MGLVWVFGEVFEGVKYFLSGSIFLGYFCCKKGISWDNAASSFLRSYGEMRRGFYFVGF